MSTSGEYNTFTFVGGLIAGGGGGIENAVCGFILLEQQVPNPFCTKLLEDSSSTCGIMRHGTHKFNVSIDYAFIKFNDVQAYCTPSFDVKTLSNEDQVVLLSVVATALVWESTLEALTKGERLGWLQFPDRPQASKVGTSSPQRKSLALESPRESDIKCGVFAAPPSLSFDSNSSTVSGSVNALLDLNSEGNLTVRIQKIETKLAKIKLAWPKPRPPISG
jgi:hypothetical protein